MTFYKHFRNKKDLVLQIIKKLYDDAIDEGKSVLRSSKPHRQRVADLLEWKIKMLDQQTPPMLLDIKDYDPSLEKFIKQKSSESLLLFKDFIRDGQEEGVFRKNLNMGFLLHIFQILSNSFFSENLEQYFESYEDYIREYLDFLFYGLTEREDKA
ncbi:MAG: Regulatory protein TetR [Marinimicrobia bacterium 46_47]|nr:MAG: Regulatory protein TetR [Marinimicrobia bacterium 46_47]